MHEFPWQKEAVKKYRSVLFFRPKGSSSPFTLVSYDGSHISMNKIMDIVRQKLRLTEKTKVQLWNARTETELNIDDESFPSYTYLLYSLSSMKGEEEINYELSMLERIIRTKGRKLKESSEIQRIIKIPPLLFSAKLGNSVTQAIHQNFKIGSDQSTLTKCECCGLQLNNAVRINCCRSVLCDICCEYSYWECKYCPICGTAGLDKQFSPMKTGVSTACYSYGISPEIFERAREVACKLK